MTARLGIGESFDVIERELIIGDRPAVCYFVDGFIKDKVSLDVIRRLQELARAGMVPNTAEKLERQLIAHSEVTVVETMEDAVDQILSGPLVFFFSGQTKAMAVDVREYPVRSIEEPDLEKVTRGAHDGFTETIVFNTALIRRRLRDPDLRFEMMNVGVRSKTDVAVGYISGLTDPDLVQKIKKRIEGISTDALPMGSKSLEPFVVKNPWNPLPRVRYTERPDVATAHLLEGHVLVIVDTTPMAMILPVTFFHFLEHAEEYFQSPFIGTYLRLIRAVGFFITAFLTPLWLALYFVNDRLPEFLSFIGPKEPSTLSVGLQLVILDFGIDLIRMALIHTPSALATSLGIVGAILLGELAVEVGLFIPETILYTAVVAIGYYAVPSQEMGYAIRLYRYSLLFLAMLFNVYGIAFGAVAGLVILITSRSIETPFLWPLIPFDGRSLIRVLVTLPASTVGSRPALLENKSADRSKTAIPKSGGKAGRKN